MQLMQLKHGDVEDHWRILKEHAYDIWIYHGSAGMFKTNLGIARRLWWAFYPFRSELKVYAGNECDISEADVAYVLESRENLVEWIKKLELY